MQDRRVAEAERVAREATSSPALRVVARGGYAASAVLRVLIGAFALLLAVRVPGPHPDVSGAFGAIDRVPGGFVLLVVLAAGQGALTLWLLLSGLLQIGPTATERWRRRTVDWGRAVAYGVIGATAVRFAVGAGSDSAQADRDAGRRLLAVPGGAVVLALLGLVVLITGLSFAWIGGRLRFRRTIRLPRRRGRRRVVLVLGVVGYVLQGASIAAVGVFLVIAALTLDVRRAGLDGTLGAFAADPAGRTFLVLLALGWIVSGVYAGVRTVLARLD